MTSIWIRRAWFVRRATTFPGRDRNHVRNHVRSHDRDHEAARAIAWTSAGLLALLFALAQVPLWTHWWFVAIVVALHVVLLRRLIAPVVTLLPRQWNVLRRLLQAMQS